MVGWVGEKDGWLDGWIVKKDGWMNGQDFLKMGNNMDG